MPKIGFTGTQLGMTHAQAKTVDALLAQHKRKAGPNEVHHGDCIGADANVHLISRKQGYKVIGHPPIDDKKRAFCLFDREFFPQSYLARNRDIVNHTKFLIAAPKGFKEELRSGTWSTVRYARKQGKRVIVVFPDGTEEVS